MNLEGNYQTMNNSQVIFGHWDLDAERERRQNFHFLLYVF